MGGTADELSPTSWVDTLAAGCSAPTSITRYAGGRHSMTETPATALGPSWRGLTLDWLQDRVRGLPATDAHRVVTPAGQVQELPHPRERQPL